MFFPCMTKVFGIGGIADTFRFIFYNPESYCHSILQISTKKDLHLCKSFWWSIGDSNS